MKLGYKAYKGEIKTIMFQKVSNHGDTNILTREDTACDEDMIFSESKKSWYFISI